VLKSKNSPGPIRLVASAAGLAPDTLTLNSAAPDNSPLPFLWPQSGAVKTAPAAGSAAPGIRKIRGHVIVTIRGPCTSRVSCRLLSPDGKVTRSAFAGNAPAADFSLDHLPSGVYFLEAGANLPVRIMVTN
jgi:hypothetical protein